MFGFSRLVAAGDDRRELVATLAVCDLVAVVSVSDHVVIAGAVRGPEVDYRVGNRSPILIKDATGEDELGLVAWFQKVRAHGCAQPEIRSFDLTRRLG